MYYIALAVSSVLVGLISSRWRIIREPIAASLALYTIFNGNLTTTSPTVADVHIGLMVSVATDSNSAVWGYCAFGGFGLGLCLSALIAAAQLSAPPELM